MTDFDVVERTRYVTEFRERESGRKLFRSGQFLGTLVVSAGQQPFPERVKYYDVVEIHKTDRTMNGAVAVFETAGVTEEDCE